MLKVSSFAIAGFLTFASTQAHALNARTWVSGTGVDQAGCGPISSPCRTLQYAHDNTTPGGEIDVKDSAGYGSLTINKAITVVGDGSLAGVLAQSGANAITINAGASDSVVLRGLAIEGSKVGANGIVFNSGGALTVANCLVQGFVGTGTTGNGIYIRHTAGLPQITVTGTTTSYNQYIGIVFSPSGSGGGRFSVSRTTLSHNGYGLSLYGADTTATVSTAIMNSEAMNNTMIGFLFYGHETDTERHSTLAYSFALNNGTTGISVNNHASLDLSHVTANRNASGDLICDSTGYVVSDKTNSISSNNFNATTNYFTHATN